MRLIWTPPGADKREFVFKVHDVLSPDAEAVELVGGEAWTTWDEFTVMFNKGQRRALRAALWIARRRDGEPLLQFSDLVLRTDELHVDYDDDELRAMRKNVRESRSKDMTDELRAALIEALGGDQPGDEGDESPDPKATPSGSPPTPAATEQPAADTAG